MQKISKISIVLVLCCLMSVLSLTTAFGSVQTKAATFNELNAPGVFLKQQGSDTCTLCANTMMLRRTALLRGDSDWYTITESSCRYALWYEYVGMYSSYSYRNIYVTSTRIYGNTRSELINLLRQHPEGIVAYDYDHPHAILLTDYSNGVFYCADPANYIASGRIPNSQAMTSVDSIEAVWYVTSPTVGISGESSDNQTEDKTPEVTTVREYWKVKASAGINVRQGAGLGYSVKGLAANGMTLKILKKTSVDGYTWGYTETNALNGWVALNYAQKVTVPTLTNQSVLSADSISMGSSVKVKAVSSGGSGSLEYCYSYQKAGSSVWTDIRDYSASTAVTFTPDAAGTYYIRVKIHDKVTGAVAQLKKSLTVYQPLSNTSVLSSQYTTVGHGVTVRGVSKGGKGTVQYTFYYKKSGAVAYSLLQGYSTNNKASFVPGSAGTYEILVKVKDENNTIVKKVLTLTVTKS